MNGNIKYNYILVDKRMYINIENTLIGLLFILYSRTKPFKLFEGPTRFRLIKHLPLFVIKTMRVFRFAYKVHSAKKHYSKRKNHVSITTQHYGHCLLMLRQGGIKVFDLKKQTVTTVFSNYLTKAEVSKNIERIRNATKCQLAPRIIKSDVSERFVIEGYLNISRSSFDQTDLDKYYSSIFPILESILLATRPKVTNLSNLFEKRVNDLESLIEYFQIDKMSNSNDTKIIRGFLIYIKDFHKKSYQEEVYLVFSHGDLWEGNILLSRNHKYVIDWETLGYRSFYFDFYYAMFMLFSKNDHFNKVDKKGIDDLVQIIEVSCNLFYKKLRRNNKHQYNIKNLECFDDYRYLFYLELISMKLENIKTHKSSHIEEVITWIKRFKVFEEKRFSLSLDTFED